MDKIIIYGAGAALRHCLRYVDIEQIQAIIDKNAQSGTQILGKPFVSPEQVKDIPFDICLISSNKYFYEMRSTAIEVCGIAPDKVLHWSSYCTYDNPQQVYTKIKHILESDHIVYVLDHGMNIEKCGSLFFSESIKIMGLSDVEKREADTPTCCTLYEKVYNKLDKIAASRMDAVILGKAEQYRSVGEIEDLLAYYCRSADICFLDIPYPDTERGLWAHSIEYEKYGDVEFSCLTGRILVTIRNSRRRKATVYVAAHKAFMPLRKRMYQTIWLGEEEDNQWGYICDKKQPDNIGHLNAVINECTGMYWIWKYADSDYLGLVHYRRYFLRENVDAELSNILDYETLTGIMREYDIIVYPMVEYGDPIYVQLRESISQEAFEVGEKLIRTSLEKNQPEYIEAYRRTMEGYVMFSCNMFITRREIFCQYCEWLFSIILEPANQIDVSSYDSYSKRVIGFFAERLFTTWLMRQELKMKEMPVLMVDEGVN